MRRSDNRRGSALLETGIALVLAGILVGLAWMRFERAQARSKIAEARGDLRTIATALEAYRVEYGVFPYDGYNWNGSPSDRYYGYWFLPNELSTPVAYVANARMADPFRLHTPDLPVIDGFRLDGYRYANVDSTWGITYDSWETRVGSSVYYDDLVAEFGGFRLSSAGPDGTYGPNGWNGLSTQLPYGYPASALQVPYDPTNGASSAGDLIRSEKSITGYLNAGGI
jgi:type II secretory pathway pseudopilin PulG